VSLSENDPINSSTNDCPVIVSDIPNTCQLQKNSSVKPVFFDLNHIDFPRLEGYNETDSLKDDPDAGYDTG